MRPEVGAAGYARDDSTVEFYQRINALLRPDSKVLDLGAGRGAAGDAAPSFARDLVMLRGKVKLLAGVDIDPVVKTNPYLDEAHIIDANGAIPYPEQAFDLIVSDWVLEHIDDTAAFVREVDRLLKPGGWFCARTPNKWGYIALSSRLTPSALEGWILNRVQPGRLEKDVFPKRYLLNTLNQIASAFEASRWVSYSYAGNATPAYHGGRRALFWAIDVFQKLVPRGMKTVLFVFIQKRGQPQFSVGSQSEPTQLNAKA